MDLISVPGIAAAVYAMIEAYKVILTHDTAKRLIPIISALLGVVLGVFVYYTMPGLIPATDLLGAILIGCASGISATGGHQIVSQLAKIGKTTDFSAPFQSETTTANPPAIG